MKHFIFLLIVLFALSANVFSQTVTDTVSNNLPLVNSVVIQKVDSAQMERIDGIEKNLTAFYTYNRRSHALLYLSTGLSFAGILLASTSRDNVIAGAVTLTGGVVGIIGTVIYLDSYKFLNFKPRRKEIRGMTYY